MKTISFTVPGQIGGKKRPRTFRQGGKIVTWSPKSPEHTIIQHCAQMQAMRGVSLLKGPLRLRILIHRKPPKGWSKKKRAEAVWVTGKPDLDNQTKQICDCLNKIVWDDDAQIASLAIDRTYSMTLAENVQITVTELE